MDKLNYNNMFPVSVYEAYIKLYEKMNELINQSNELVIDTDKKLELMKQILDEGLEGIKPEINNQLYELINNGTIEEIINTNIFNDLNSQIKEIVQYDENVKNNDNKYKILLNDINSSDTLDFSNILLKGSKKINSTNINNLLKTVSNNEGLNYTKINSYNDLCDFAKFKKALNSGRNIRIVVWGDSISTSNGDVLNCNQFNFSGSEKSPNGLTTFNTYFSNLIDMFTTAFPFTTFDFYNRAIGGERISSWEVEKTFNGVTKKWIDHVKDLEADLVLIAFGMNDDIKSCKSFSFILKSIFDYMPSPDYAIITTPRPALVNDSTYGIYKTQFAKEISAESARIFARNKGAYIIDVSRLSNIKRIGTDFINPTFKYKELNITETNGGVNNGGYTLINSLCKNFILEFDCNAIGTTSITIQYNFIPNTDYDNRLVINQSGITLHTKFSDYANWGNASKKFTGSPIGKIKIKKRNEYISVYLNGNCILRDVCEVGYPFGKIMFSSKNSDNNISNIKLYIDEYQYYTPSITETEMYGEFVNNDYNTKQPFGGNGVNHPSTIGLREVYLPCLQEFINDLIVISKTTNGIYSFDEKDTVSLNKVGASYNPNDDLYFVFLENNVISVYVPGLTFSKKMSFKTATSDLNADEYSFVKYNDNGVYKNMLILRSSSSTLLTEIDIIKKIIL